MGELICDIDAFLLLPYFNSSSLHGEWKLSAFYHILSFSIPYYRSTYFTVFIFGFQNPNIKWKVGKTFESDVTAAIRELVWPSIHLFRDDSQLDWRKNYWNVRKCLKNDFIACNCRFRDIFLGTLRANSQQDSSKIVDSGYFRKLPKKWTELKHLLASDLAQNSFLIAVWVTYSFFSHVSRKYKSRFWNHAILE